jgi:hypothetical protein
MPRNSHASLCFGRQAHSGHLTFDFHLILKHLPEDAIFEDPKRGKELVDLIRLFIKKRKKIRIRIVIAKTMEKYMAFGKFQFIDTLNFFPEISIDKLGEILDKSNGYNFTLKFKDKKHHQLLERKNFP